MDNLPEDILQKIYKSKHEMEFIPVLQQIVLYRLPENLYFTTKRELIKYLKNNINDIDCVVLNNGRKISIHDYLKFNKRIFNILFNVIYF